MLYATLPYSSEVSQFDLTRNVEVRSFAAGDRALALGPVDVAVRPGSPETVAVSMVRLSLPTQNFKRITVYDQGVPRAKSTGPDEDYGMPDGISEIEWTDADHLVGYDIKSTGCSLHRLVLLPDGLRAEFSVGDRHGYCFHDQLNLVNGRLITRSGIEFDPTTLATLRYWPGVDSDTGGGLLDPARDAFLRINGGSLAGLNSNVRGRAAVEEYESTRDTLRRSFVTDSPSSWGGFPYVVDLTMAGSGRVVFTLYDSASGDVVLHAFNLASVPTMAAATFETVSATAEGVTGVAVDMAPVAVGYDPAQARLVVALPASIGPNGNSLAIVEPNTGAVERIIPLPGEPRQLAVSTTGSLAYVSSPGNRWLAQVDLIAGQVTHVARVRADRLAIKEDEPTVVAAMRNDRSNTTTITTLRNLTAYGDVIAVTTNPRIAMLDWIGSSGDKLIGLSSSTTDLTLAHFGWGNNGLTLESAVSVGELGLASTPGLAFNQLWNSVSVIDLSTLERRGTWPGGTWWSVLSSRSAAITAGPAQNFALAVSWVQAPMEGATSSQWQGQYTTLIADSVLSEAQVSSLPWRMVSTGGNRVAVPVHWNGSGARANEPGRLYLLNRP